MKRPFLLITSLLISFQPKCMEVQSFSTPTNRRRRQQPRIRSGNNQTGPKGQRRQRNTSKENKQQEDTFDPKILTHSQIDNINAPSFSIFHDGKEDRLRLRPTNQGVVTAVTVSSRDSSKQVELIGNDNNQEEQRKGKTIRHNHFEMLSLDDLFPNIQFSQSFYTDSQFREDIRHAMRQDVFESTPSYSNLSPKVKAMMLHDDSSLQGSWNCHEKPRMKLLTKVLQSKLGTGNDVPTGDEFMMSLGRLCGYRPSTHWMDIIGVKDRVVTHSWHQDTGRSHPDAPPYYDNEDHSQDENSCYTVMLGFPMEDEYDGTGVFSHVIKLSEEHWAPDGMYSGNEPVLFTGKIDQKCIVRPSFGLGREILRYRDIDVLHSAPDVIYRSSVMRFM